MSLLTSAQLADFRQLGHVTVTGVFAPGRMDEIIHDIERWGEEVLADLPPARRAALCEPRYFFRSSGLAV